MAQPPLPPLPPPLSLRLWFQVGDEYLRKQHRVLADLHYGQAGRLFQLLKDTPCELLRVQLERVAFAEFQMSSKSRVPPQSGRRRWAGFSSSQADLRSLSGIRSGLFVCLCSFSHSQ